MSLYWSNFIIKKASIDIKIYGRENAWNVENKFYLVDGQIIYEGNMQFRLQISNVEILNNLEIQTVVIYFVTSCLCFDIDLYNCFSKDI